MVARQNTTYACVVGVMAGDMGKVELAQVDAWWRAANHVSVGQVYLLNNPLLRDPLQRRHAMPRLLGHVGTTPVLNFLGRLAQNEAWIRAHGEDMPEVTQWQWRS